MAELGHPPTNMRGFPRKTLRAGTTLVRIHRCVSSPWWFNCDGRGRFDLADPEGTCYLAQSPAGAFIEVFRGFVLIAEADVNVRCLARLTLPGASVLADCTSPRALAFGVTGAMHTTTDYALTHQWAAAFRRARFAGIRYFCGHDPSQHEVGVALFGTAGAGAHAIYSTGPIDSDIRLDVQRRFGVRVVPTP